jgi:hypothetical protein
MDRIATMATNRRAHRSANLMYVDRTRSLGLLMSFDGPATPVEIVRVGHSALGNGTRSVPQELFGTPALHELIEVMGVTLAGNGVGLAAPQIAAPLRLFAVEDTQERMGHLTPNSKRLAIVIPSRSRQSSIRSGTRLPRRW